ncbi:MAG: hypothetical protein IKQ27_14425 [Lachnospiraceae bacterium]|jgi:hypothetical protein|nr:hypothetical protein [Lachnospiraceae bacterium]MBR3104285.1 hypothetical protein [Lachnospiraceae bacterium]MBR3736825.1 hypothetical protein [Lachnospiraceae bacterium]MBR6158150.1 hypothetical protein [Lachnospiraceae bacterium]MBR6849046.1 hypothetical protein [Lachnospiraceae bacterium]
MKNVWNENVKGTLLLYFGLYTIATITNSILYLAQGIFEDPAGNWHELDRAILVMIVTVAYALIKYIKVKNFALKTLIVYVPTMLLVFGYVFLRGLTAELAKSAYRDIFICYTMGYAVVTVIVLIAGKIKGSKRVTA